jgi:hypothetical protein
MEEKRVIIVTLEEQRERRLLANSKTSQPVEPVEPAEKPLIQRRQQDMSYQSDPDTVWPERTYQPWKDLVDRKNAATQKRRAIRSWRRKQRRSR